MTMKQRRRRFRRRRRARKERVAELKHERNEIRDQMEKLRDKREQSKDKEERQELAERIADLRERRQWLNERILVGESAIERLTDRIKRLTRRIRRRLRRRENQLSPNFSIGEFHCRDGTHVPQAAIPALQHLCRAYLENLRDRFGPVRINSGYRTRSYNASIGGASNSVHIYDAHPSAVAADITCDRGRPSDWANYLDNLNPGGMGRYSTFVHVDNRQRMNWSRARWYG